MGLIAPPIISKMAIIPTQGDPTLDAIRRAYEQKPQEQRKYVGASSIGDPCARKLWYRFNGYQSLPFESATLFRFEDGHRTEDLMIERLRMVEGVTVWNKDENGNQFGLNLFDGKFKGHVDGIIKGLLQSPKTPHVLEIKCTEDLNKFRKVKYEKGDKNALKNWNETYFVQAQIYMQAFDLTRHYTVVASAGGRDFDSCRTEYEKEVAQRYKDRAFEIIKAEKEPQKVSDKPDFWLCRMCEFREICHKSN